MNYLLFSGPTNSGKTTIMTYIRDYLTSKKAYQIIEQIPAIPNGDFRCALSKNDKILLLNSASDSKYWIGEFVKFKAKYPTAETIITVSRNKPDYMHTEMENAINKKESDFLLTIPMGRMPRGTTRKYSLPWYSKQTQHLAKHILLIPPFSI